jgi:hypothetical protein
MLGESDGNGTKPIRLASFEIKDGTAEFDWCPGASAEELKGARKRLRECILKITTTDKVLHYAILREKPNAITGPLRIRSNSARQVRNSAPYAPLDKTSRKPFRHVDWEQEDARGPSAKPTGPKPRADRDERRGYKNLGKNLVITKLTIKRDKRDSQDEIIPNGRGWSFAHGQTRLLDVKLDESEDRYKGLVKFQFTMNPYDGDEVNAPIIEDLLDASYSIVIGLRIDQDHVFEIARIEIEPEKPR